MLIVAQGNCPRCGKSYSDFNHLSIQGTFFYCDHCDSKHVLCPNCRAKIDKCPKCSGRLLDEWEHTQKKLGIKGQILF